MAVSLPFLKRLRHKEIARRVLRTPDVKRLRARIMVLTEDLEIADSEAGKAQESAAYWEDRFCKIVETATVVLRKKDAAEDKLKEIAKLVDSDHNNGMILGGYEMTATIRRILK